MYLTTMSRPIVAV